MTAAFISDESEARRIDSVVDRAVLKGADLPQQVFQPSYRNFLFCTYSNLQTPECWASLISNFAGKDGIDLVFLDPDYRWLHSRGEGLYGAIRIGSGSSWAEIGEALSRSLTGSPADTFDVMCNKCLIAPRDVSWIIYGDRRWDVAIVAAQSKIERDEFKARANGWLDIETADEVEQFVNHDDSRKSSTRIWRTISQDLRLDQRRQWQLPLLAFGLAQSLRGREEIGYSPSDFRRTIMPSLKI